MRKTKSFPCIRAVVESVIRDHPKECIFAPGAVDSIVRGAWRYNNKEDLIDYLTKAIGDHEIYCPHEGIDRRAEFGLI